MCEKPEREPSGRARGICRPRKMGLRSFEQDECRGWVGWDVCVVGEEEGKREGKGEVVRCRKMRRRIKSFPPRCGDTGLDSGVQRTPNSWPVANPASQLRQLASTCTGPWRPGGPQRAKVR